MMDKFFSQEYCDRCGGSLKEGRIMSMFNTDCICIKCKQKEREREDYQIALEADRKAYESGIKNYPGIGFKNS